MDIKATAAVIGLVLSGVCMAEPSRADLLRFFMEWQSGECRDSGMVKYAKVKDIITPRTVEADSTDDAFTEGIYESVVNDDDEAAIADVDEDGIDEVFLLLLQGSGRFPVFYGFRKNAKSGKYTLLLREERYVDLAVLGGHIRFVESFREFDSGRRSSFSILEMDRKGELVSIAKVSVTYVYELETVTGKYISSDQLNMIASQDYGFSGLAEDRPTDFSLMREGKTLRAHVNWTSVGYFATTIDLRVSHDAETEKVFDRIWGFSVNAVNGEDFLCVVKMDDQRGISTIRDFRISIYRLRDWKLVVSRYLEAKEILSIE